MVRTQIQLSEEQVVILKKMAEAQHKSMAEIIRQAVNFFAKAQVEEKQRRLRALQSVGRFGSGLPDLGQSHDEYLAEDFGR